MICYIKKKTHHPLSLLEPQLLQHVKYICVAWLKMGSCEPASFHIPEEWGYNNYNQKFSR